MAWGRVDFFLTNFNERFIEYNRDCRLDSNSFNKCFLFKKQYFIIYKRIYSWAAKCDCCCDTSTSIFIYRRRETCKKGNLNSKKRNWNLFSLAIYTFTSFAEYSALCCSCRITQRPHHLENLLWCHSPSTRKYRLAQCVAGTSDFTV